jgi:hypothetical protein
LMPTFNLVVLLLLSSLCVVFSSFIQCFTNTGLRFNRLLLKYSLIFYYSRLHLVFFSFPSPYLFGISVLTRHACTFCCVFNAVIRSLYCSQTTAN